MKTDKQWKEFESSLRQEIIDWHKQEINSLLDELDYWISNNREVGTDFVDVDNLKQKIAEMKGEKR